MFSFKTPARTLAATLAIAGLLVPAIASAQQYPPPAYGQPPYGQPQYGQPQYGQPQDESIHGRIYSINSTFNITVTDDNGFMDNVELHQGTVINPTGLTLAPGMEVTIAGYNGGPAFEANEIDTPYTYYGPQPVPVYYGSGWWYPGYSYGYGPSFLLDVVFGGGGWRYERHGFDRNIWAVRSDDRYRGSRGYAPRTAPRSNGYVQRNDTSRSYSAPARNSSVRGNVNVNANLNVNSNYANRGNTNTNYSGRNNANANTNYSGRNNANANTNYSARNNANANTNYSGRNNGNNAGNAGYRSAPQAQTRPANTRTTGSNESRTTNTSHSSDSGSRGDHNNQH
jgi:hypothetical protein